MVVESWESIKGNQNVQLFHRALFQALANSMHKTVYHRAHECLRVMELEQQGWRRVILSFGLCLES